MVQPNKKQSNAKLQWHPAFCAAAELELRLNKADLEFKREYNLSKKPLQMDLLIIEKRKNVQIQNEIGRIFRRHNVIEYKSPCLLYTSPSPRDKRQMKLAVFFVDTM